MFSEIVDSISKYHATFGCFYTIVQLSLELLANSLIIPMIFLFYWIIRRIWNDILRHYKSFDSLDWFVCSFTSLFFVFALVAIIRLDQLLFSSFFLIWSLGLVLSILVRLKYKEKRK